MSDVSLMVERLLFLPVTLLVVLIATRLELTYVGLAILAGVMIPIVSLVRDRDMFSTTALGYALVAIGLALLVLTYGVSSYYGIAFEALDQDRTFPRVVRRLPYYGLASLIAGVTAIAICRFRQR